MPRAATILRGRRRRGEAGIALLAVLILLLAIGVSSASFLWFMNQHQTRAGARLRAAAALAIAEAGVHRTLSVLESVAPDGKGLGQTWRPAAYAESVGVGPLAGRFTIAITEETDGVLVVTSTREVGGVRRRLRAHVVLASTALQSAIYSRSVVYLTAPLAMVVIARYGTGVGHLPWAHIAAGGEIWFATPGSSINPSDVALEGGTGPMDPPGTGPQVLAVPKSVRLVLAPETEMTLGEDRRPVQISHLRASGIHIEGEAVRTQAFPILPAVDRAYYQALASANTSNLATNQLAGRFLGDDDLARKRDSLYSLREFQQVQAYLAVTQRPPRLTGALYVRGGVVIPDGQSLQMTDGTVITEGSVVVGEGAGLEILHSAVTRARPGLLVLDNGALVIGSSARVRVHGLVYASRLIDIHPGAVVDIVGALAGHDSGLSLRLDAATLMVRYDPAVMGTPGIRAPDNVPVVAWVTAWEEFP